jgi:hypothetical protein
MLVAVDEKWEVKPKTPSSELREKNEILGLTYRQLVVDQTDAF